MTPSPWFVVLCSPQHEIQTVWRLHLLGQELFVPVIRRRIKTGRKHNGRHLTRVVARPMFPCYGFIRQSDALDLEAIRNVRGVRDFLRNEVGEPVVLPDAAVMAVYAKQQEVHGEFLSRRARRQSHDFKPGDLVRVDDGSSYTGLMTAVDRISSHDRIEVLFGMIRHSLPADMVAAA